MSELSLRDSVTINEDVVFRELGGEAVVLNLETGIYFGLNDVGTRIWQLIGEHQSLDKVLSTLVEEYDVTPAVLERDLLQMVGQLCTKGLTRVGTPS